jgi:hypothetical protein
MNEIVVLPSAVHANQVEQLAEANAQIAIHQRL